MPYRRDPAKAVEVLDLALDFFGHGEHWMKEKLGDSQGNRCRVGALRTIRRQRGISFRMRCIASLPELPILPISIMVTASTPNGRGGGYRYRPSGGRGW